MVRSWARLTKGDDVEIGQGVQVLDGLDVVVVQREVLKLCESREPLDLGDVVEREVEPCQVYLSGRKLRCLSRSRASQGQKKANGEAYQVVEVFDLLDDIVVKLELHQVI